MADVRCPMCGKPNSSDAEECKYCQARLKPLVVSPFSANQPPAGAPIRSGQGPTPKNTSDLEQALPDWLKDLRREEGSSEGEPDAAQPEETAPDWLQRSGAPSNAPLDSSSAAEEAPDWLSRLENPLDGGSKDLEPTGDQGKSDEEVPDWLTSLGGEASSVIFGEQSVPDAPAAKPPAAPPLAPVEPAPQEAEPEWLARIREKQKAERVHGIGLELPDEQFLGKQPEAGQPGEGYKPSSGAFADADWLSAFGEAGTGSEKQAGPAEPAESVPDWVSQLGGSAGTPAAPSEEASPFPSDTADWLSGSESSNSSQPPAAAASAGAEAGEIPDWLASLGGSEPGGEKPGEPPAQSAAGPNAGETPDWLSAFGAPGLAEKPEEPGESQAQPAESIPDWMGQFSGAGEQAAAPIQEQPPFPAEASDWMSEIDQAAAGQPTPSAGETPDWLSQFGAGEETPQPASPAQMPDWLAEASGTLGEAPKPAEGTPDWLSQVSPEDQTAASEPAEAQPAESTPDWLKALGSSGPGDAGPAPAGEGGQPVFAAEGEQGTPVQPAELGAVPDWLSQVPQDETGEGGTPAEGEALPADLERASLPTWLEAMRPLEAGAPEAVFADGAQVETSGPLAGIAGILPAEPDVTRIQKPAAFPLKLRIGDTQQKNAELFNALLQGESEARPLPARPLITTQYILRLLVAVLLFVAVFAAILEPAYLGADQSNLLPLPGVENAQGGFAEIARWADMYDISKPVLLVVDYQPGLAPEMEAGSAALLNAITSRTDPQTGAQPYLVLVSSSPTGPILAERLISNISSQNGITYTNYTNLGFVPGGPAGILGFSLNPQFVTPYDIRFVDVWPSDPLANVKKLSDFAMLVVMTDDADTARAWIEQAQPQLGGKPLLMFTSAQVEPMVRPYYDSQQVTGLLAGLPGGALFEGSRGRFSLARQYWDAFGAGLLLACAIILVGGAAYAVINLVSTRRQAKAEGDV